ncbi:YOR378W-like protein [Rhizodiscina lignyota]|uniref:YOR378W-like protein n=1 Tax=Rhizodiscina lignyota TaxID=1504668 RepID=A0A9P4MBG8_9PEZI|nr:YOR378W-like protein [Rhizodiscina lignyota]
MYQHITPSKSPDDISIIPLQPQSDSKPPDSLSEKSSLSFTSLPSSRYDTPLPEPPPDPVATPATTGPGFSKLHEVAFIINVCLAQFLSLAALSQTVAPLPIIGNYFNVSDPGTLSWFTAAFSLTVGTFILPSGRLGDMFGHKIVFMFGWGWLSVWSIVTGFSYSSGVIMLSICRAVQGIGPALIVPNAMALIGRTYPVGMKRSLILSCFGAAGPTGFVVGAAISSTFAQLIWWPWSFWALAIISIFVLLISSFILPSKDQIASLAPASQGPPKPPAKFDYLGSFTGVSGLVLFNFALNQAPIAGWSAPYILNMFYLGTILLIAFVIVEFRFAQQPLIPLHGLQKEAWFTLVCIACGWGSHGIWIYYFYLFLENVRGHSALLATAQIAPVAISGAAFALSTGYLLKKMNAAWVMFIAMFCFTAGTVLLATAPVGQTYWLQTFLSIIITPGGMNLSFPAGMILLSNAMPREHQGIAASFVSTIVNYSISCGLGLAATIVVEASDHGTKALHDYQEALYFGIGLSGLGLIISVFFVWQSRNA